MFSFLVNYFVDDGGGMDPDKMRQCMSLGYSVKSKIANTIGQCKF
jgi:sensor histidine kinase regulating citrate/malate metabolism